VLKPPATVMGRLDGICQARGSARVWGYFESITNLSIATRGDTALRPPVIEPCAGAYGGYALHLSSLCLSLSISLMHKYRHTCVGRAIFICTRTCVTGIKTLYQPLPPRLPRAGKVHTLSFLGGRELLTRHEDGARCRQWYGHR
jgi:hypothetical protein